MEDKGRNNYGNGEITIFSPLFIFLVAVSQAASA